jgi:hypothetical protein
MRLSVFAFCPRVQVPTLYSKTLLADLESRDVEGVERRPSETSVRCAGEKRQTLVAATPLAR